MKKGVLILGLLAFTLVAKSQTDYVQVEVMSIKPKLDKMDMFKKGLAAHNKKFHAADPYKVGIYSSLTGPNSGQYTWVMGPSSWTQLDARPVKGEHDLDWDKNVVPFCESFGEVAYWRLDKDISYQAPNSTTLTKSRLRLFTILPGQGDRAAELFKKVAEIYKRKQYAASYNAYWKQGASTGPHLAVIISFGKWAHFDNTSTLVKDYEEINGANSWQRFLDDLALCIDRTKTFDELSEYNPDLSSN